MSQVALVTGAASGLGKAIATHLLAQGYRVALTDVDEARAQQTAESLDDGQGNVLALGLDIRQPQDFARALELTQARFGELHVLVNNAALTLATPVMEISVEEFDRVIATNLRGTFVGCQTMGATSQARAMAESSTWPHWPGRTAARLRGRTMLHRRAAF